MGGVNKKALLIVSNIHIKILVLCLTGTEAACNHPRNKSNPGIDPARQPNITNFRK